MRRREEKKNRMKGIGRNINHKLNVQVRFMNWSNNEICVRESVRESVFGMHNK